MQGYFKRPPGWIIVAIRYEPLAHHWSLSYSKKNGYI